MTLNKITQVKWGKQHIFLQRDVAGKKNNNRESDSRVSPQTKPIKLFVDYCDRIVMKKQIRNVFTNTMILAFGDYFFVALHLLDW